MKNLSKIIRGYGISKTVGSSQPREFLGETNSIRNIWFSKRRYAY